MRTRKLELGTRNLIGARVTQLRLARGMKQVELLAQLQLRGVDLSIPALSLLEGQRRPVSDIELYALAEILGVSADELLGRTSVKHGGFYGLLRNRTARQKVPQGAESLAGAACRDGEHLHDAYESY